MPRTAERSSICVREDPLKKFHRCIALGGKTVAVQQSSAFTGHAEGDAEEKRSGSEDAAARKKLHRLL